MPFSVVRHILDDEDQDSATAAHTVLSQILSDHILSTGERASRATASSGDTAERASRRHRFLKNDWSSDYLQIIPIN